ncbi:MAG: PAS domain-containing sensor histidine kinase [Rhizobiaceae bacterium]|nr:PAS domain-containing sensor histidine kinase [Hyphomicrobiales bacterium]NRB31068.1 PAS domain-containing sensor histidine kinase [Rhizobiaceae bacterium]
MTASDAAQAASGDADNRRASGERGESGESGVGGDRADTVAAGGAAGVEPVGVSGSSLKYARRYGAAFVLLVLVFGAASFLVLLGLTSIEPTETVILAVTVINGVLVTAMLVLVGREVYSLLQARKRGRAAARMHIRIVGLFAIVASFPAIIVAVVAGITLDLGLDRIFDARTRTIVTNSVSVAESYVEETASTLNSNTLSMGFLLSRNRSAFVLDRGAFEQFMRGQSRARGLLNASIIRSNGSVILTVDEAESRRLPEVPPGLMELAQAEKPACGGPKIRNLAGCVVKLKGLGDDHYLYTLRSVDAGVLNSIQLMEEITEEYNLLESGRLPLQIAFALLYVGICLTILLAAVWMGIAVADRLVEPIRRLIAAADKVATGDLEVSVPITRSEGELRSLADTFNSMTSELRAQRDEILDNQEQIDRRRRFTEAVLSGVTAGVIGVSPEGRLAIANSSASTLLGKDADTLVGEPLSNISAELGEVLDNAERSGKRSYLEQISFNSGSGDRTLNVQVSVDHGAEGDNSHVITIDDITDLVSAQRTSAWADVARRIAHEIKNPLTPIQLSAERIRRRYGKVITEDREVFDQCTDTIVRQVADIGRMVDEFSSFARMPKPTLVVGDLREPLREAVFLLKVSHPEIDFQVNLDEQAIVSRFDSRLLGQAFGNLIKNASEAMEGVEFAEGETPFIQVNHELADDMHRIDIVDNGKGLPTENRQRLLEPYMTTREKGTGLGLAIVGKILEEHGGRIELMDAPQVATGGHGALMRIYLPVSGRDADGEVELEGVTRGI